MLLIVRISVNITGNPKEQANSIKFTDTPRTTTPIKASIKFFS